MASWSDDNLGKRLERILVTVPSDANRLVIERYLKRRLAKGKKPATLATDANTLRNLAQWLGDRKFEDVTHDDLVDYFVTVRRVRSWANFTKDGKEVVTRREVSLSETTRVQRSSVIKTFYKALLKDKPEVVAHLFDEAMPVRKKPRFSTEKLVKPEEMKRLLETTPGVREKAILAVLYETGLRASELCALNADSVIPTEFGGFLVIPEDAPKLKTNARRVWTLNTESWPYLGAWLNVRTALDTNSNAPFPVSKGRNYGCRLTAGSLYSFVAHAGRRADMKKHHPHMVRHTAVTNRVKMGWN